MYLRNWIINEKDNISSNIPKNYKMIESFSPIIIKKFDNFELIKDNALKIINSTHVFEHETVDSAFVNISRSDYKWREDENRDWFIYLERMLAENIFDLSSCFGYNSIFITAAWFQQYNHESTHGWHVHFPDHYSGVFYLDMPKNSPKTECYNMRDKSVYELDMEEGEIAIFPSYLPHRSAPNKSNETKTIISFNFSFGLPDNTQQFLNHISSSQTNG